MLTEDEGEKSRVEGLLSPYDTRRNPLYHLDVPPAYTRASVLIPLFRKNGEWHVLLTVRSRNLRAHSGLVAFPGGRQDSDDKNEVAAALREAEEEVGLNPQDVYVVAVLTPTFVRPNNMVTAVVAFIPNDFVWKANEAEVRKVFTLPLSRFLRDDFIMKKLPFHGLVACLYYFDDYVDGEVICTWGYTAQYSMRVAMVVMETDQQREIVDGNFITKDTALTSTLYTAADYEFLTRIKNAKL